MLDKVLGPFEHQVFVVIELIDLGRLPLAGLSI